MEVLTTKKNVIFDATLFTAIMACARYHDLRYNHSLGSNKGKGNSLEVGNIIHKVLEVYYKHRIEGLKRETAIGYAMTAGMMYVLGCPTCIDGTQTCKHQRNEYPGLQNTPEESEKYVVGWRWALKTCEQYFEYYKNDSWVPLAAEIVKGDILYEDDELRVLWKAKFDLIVDTNQGIFSTDHKTFKQRRNKTSLSNQFVGQCLVLKTKSVIVNKIGLQTTLKPEERFTREMVSYSDDRLDEWQNEILPYYAYKYIQYMESEYWPPDWTNCDTMYGPCIFKQVCEANRNKREEELRLNYIILPKWDPSNESVDPEE